LAGLLFLREGASHLFLKSSRRGYSFGEPASDYRLLSRASSTVRSFLPESFRGGCSFGVELFEKPDLSRRSSVQRAGCDVKRPPAV